ncbi:MAG: phage major capsid protein, partial [Proteobacteria bacterium]|nr:phage major capsid protein [Pseudomonadota bacterium]
MSIENINNKIDELNNTWEHFKSVKNSSNNQDPLLIERLEKIQSALNAQQDALTHMKSNVERPKLINKYNTDNLEDIEYKKAFSEYLRNGAENNLHVLEKKFTKNKTRGGIGYAATETMNSVTRNFLSSRSIMSSIAKVVEISADNFEIIEDKQGITGGWFADLESTIDDKEEKFNPGKRKIEVHELCAKLRIPQKILHDPALKIEEFIQHKFNDKFAECENNAFLYGDGNGRPKGILTYPKGNKWGEIERISCDNIDKLDDLKLKELFFTLGAKYSYNAKFLVNRSTLHKLRSIKDSVTNQYIWQPSSDGSMPNKLFGKEVIEYPDMPDTQGAAKGQKNIPIIA